MAKDLRRSFAGGEIAPELAGRLDLTKFQTGLALALNFEILPHGPGQNRPGTTYVNEVKFSAKKTRIVRFDFGTGATSAAQTYILELGDLYIRIHTMGATLLSGTSLTITGITQANPGVLTYVGADPANGDWMFLQAIGGMTQLNGRWVKVKNVNGAANTFELTGLDDANINTTGFGAYTAGGTTTPPLEVVSPFLEADLFSIKITQSADVLTLVHPSYDTQELKRIGATDWTLGAVSFVPGIATPAAPGLVVNGAGAKSYSYKTTALLDGTLEESLPSPAATTALADLDTAGNSIDVTTAVVAGAVRYNVYRLKNGLYGFIGQTDGSAFRDNNIAPDVSKTPAITNTPFTGADNRPGAVGYYKGRRAFAGTNNKPQNYWLTRAGTESNLNYSIPTRDDDTIAQRILAQEVNRIRHIVPLGVLVLLTSGGVFKVAPQNSDILTPASAAPSQESNDGASEVPPIITGTSVLYVQDATPRVREIKYATQTNTAIVFTSTDISVMAPHLFDDRALVDSAYVKAPHKIGYFVRDDGVLLGVTYMPEHEVIAWYRLVTDGFYESVAAVKESSEYPYYAVIRRTVNGRSVRYIERAHTRRFATQADAYFVDAGVSYSGAPVSTLSSGLWHLEGKTVSILADGGEHPQALVTNGTVALERTASKIHVGLQYTADFQTLPLANEGMPALGQGLKKDPSEVWFRVKDTMSVSAGPSFNKLRPYAARSNEPYDTPPRLKTDEIHIVVDNKWGAGGEVCVRQDKPLPVTILSMAIGYATGG